MGFRKAWNVCQVLGCMKSTLSRERERDLAKRYCGFHMPENAQKREKARRRGKFLKGLCRKRLTTARFCRWPPQPMPEVLPVCVRGQGMSMTPWKKVPRTDWKWLRVRCVTKVKGGGFIPSLRFVVPLCILCAEREPLLGDALCVECC